MEGDSNGSPSAVEPTGEEDEVMIGPGPVAPRSRKKRPLQFEQAFLDALPSAQMYFKLPFLIFPLFATNASDCLLIPA